MKKIFVLLLCALILAFNVIAIAVYAPVARAIEHMQIDLGNGLVFWFTPPFERYADFPNSGLYQDGELIYAIDNYFALRLLRRNLLSLSNDGMTFITSFRFYQPGDAVRFYERGVFVHEHRVVDLLQRGERSLEVIHCTALGNWYIWYKSSLYDRGNNLLHITTVEDRTITFDLTTGLILSIEGNSPRNYNFIFIGAGAAICIIALFLIIKRNRSKSTLAKP